MTADVIHVLHVGEKTWIRKGNLSDEQRQACLEWLGRMWGHLEDEKWQLVGEWAHSSLAMERREALAEDYARACDLTDDLRAGWTLWEEAFPQLVCANRQDVAAELAADRAAELLYALLNGEKK